MYKTYRFRIYPNEKQKRLLSKQFGCVRFIYNWAISQKDESYQKTGRSATTLQLSKQVTEMRRSVYWLKESAIEPLQSCLDNMDMAYRNFFKKKYGRPKFKKKSDRQSAIYYQARHPNFKKKLIRVPKIGWIKYSDTRNFTDSVKRMTVICNSAKKYYVYIVVKINSNIPIKPIISSKKMIGIDLGIKKFAVFSDGRLIDNPKFLHRDLKKLKRASFRFSRCLTGSKNKKRRQLELARIHESISNKRKDFLHKLTRSMVNENQVNTWAIENLNISGMVRNRKLSRHISDVGWGEFKNQLSYKCDWYGKNLLKIGRFQPSSKLCECGVKNDELKLSDRIWTCKSCGVINDRDFLAARNIKRFALLNLNTEGTSGINASGEQAHQGRSKKEEIYSNSKKIVAKTKFILSQGNFKKENE